MTTTLRQCPFSNQSVPCAREHCENCDVKKGAEALDNQRIAENMRDYWIHKADGAEPID